jgi:hypothetical protein
MVNKDCQKCGKKIDTEKESVFYLDSSITTMEGKENNQPKKSKKICFDC